MIQLIITFEGVGTSRACELVQTLFSATTKKNGKSGLARKTNSETLKPPDSVHKHYSCTNDVKVIVFSPVHASLNDVIKIPSRRDTLVTHTLM